MSTTAWWSKPELMQILTVMLLCYCVNFDAEQQGNFPKTSCNSEVWSIPFCSESADKEVKVCIPEHEAYLEQDSLLLNHCTTDGLAWNPWIDICVPATQCGWVRQMVEEKDMWSAEQHTMTWSLEIEMSRETSGKNNSLHRGIRDVETSWDRRKWWNGQSRAAVSQQWGCLQVRPDKK